MFIPFQLSFLALTGWNWFNDSSTPPTDHLSLARSLLSKHPLIDTHIDLPVQIRYHFEDNLDTFDYFSPKATRQVDLPRLRRGGVSGFFSIAYTPCEDVTKISPGPNFTNPTNDVRDTLEQIDTTHELISRYPADIALADSTETFRKNFKDRKLSHFIGIEGAHSLGNSLATLRSYQRLGVRYVTLTHTCHNAFADSAGVSKDDPLKPLHGGLSPLGKELIQEMNRLGVIVDVSHTSDDTTIQAIELSQAPVIFSHSGSRKIYDHPRNVPDEILELFKKKEDGVLMIDYVSVFVNGIGNSTVKDVANHVNHIAGILGKDRVGAGSDFDGAIDFPEGLEDVSKYENLMVELLKSSWTPQEIIGFMGGNFLRVFEKVEKVKREMGEQGLKSNMKPPKSRPDLGKGKFWGSQ